MTIKWGDLRQIIAEIFGVPVEVLAPLSTVVLEEATEEGGS